VLENQRLNSLVSEQHLQIDSVTSKVNQSSTTIYNQSLSNQSVVQENKQLALEIDRLNQTLLFQLKETEELRVYKSKCVFSCRYCQEAQESERLRYQLRERAEEVEGLRRSVQKLDGMIQELRAREMQVLECEQRLTQAQQEGERLGAQLRLRLEEGEGLKLTVQKLHLQLSEVDKLRRKVI